MKTMKLAAVVLTTAVLSIASVTAQTVVSRPTDNTPLSLKVASDVRNKSRSEQLQGARSFFTYVKRTGVTPSKIVLVDSANGQTIAEFSASELQ